MTNNYNETLSKLSSLIADDYKNGRAIDKRCDAVLPDRVDVKTALYALNRIVFAGYYANEPDTDLHRDVYDAADRIRKLIALSLRFGPTENRSECGCPDVLEDAINAQSEALTLAFFEQLPAIRALLDKDIEALFDGDPAAESKDAVVITYPGLFAIAVYRYAHELVRLGVPILPRMMTEHAHSKTGIDINPGATIGEYFFIDHGTGIVIGETTVIGNHVKIYQGVTLGALSTRAGRALVSKRRHPTIEDNVTIYSNASILGGDTVIGEGSVIGGNVFLTASVPPGTKLYKRGDEFRLELPKE